MGLEDIDQELREFTAAESRLLDTAQNVLKLETRRGLRAALQGLIGISIEVLPIVGEFEGVEDAYELARNALIQHASKKNLNNFTYSLHYLNYLEQKVKTDPSS